MGIRIVNAMNAAEVGEFSLSLSLSLCDTHPPLGVLLPFYDNNLSLIEGQLVWVVGHAVVDSLHPLLLLFLMGSKHELINNMSSWKRFSPS